MKLKTKFYFQFRIAEDNFLLLVLKELETYLNNCIPMGLRIVEV